MTGIFIGFASALWLGILTSISPCPLASNVAAISFLSKKVTHPVLVFISGLAYTLGRMVSYAILGWIIISSLLSVPQVAQFLQKYMGKVLGPLLIVTGLILSLVKDGKEIKWKNMDKIWEYVGNKERFIDYVKSGVADLLKETK